MVDDNVRTGVVVRSQEWPEIGAFSDVACDAVGVDRALDAIVFSCAYPPIGEAVEINVSVPPSMLDDQLADLPGTTGLRASFYRPEKLTGFGTCTPYCNEFVLRQADGSLVLLGRVAYPVPIPEPGEAISIPGPPWLRADTRESEAWSLPFMDLAVRNIGCEPRDGAPGLIVPLELEIPGDRGLIHVAHAAEVQDISIGGASFDLVVRAYNDLDPPTKYPQDTVVEFVAVRSNR